MCEFRHVFKICCLSSFLVLCGTAAARPDTSVAEVEITADAITFIPITTHELLSMTVRIVDPEDRLVLDTTSRGEGVGWVPEEESVEGFYRYEATVIFTDPKYPATEEEERRGITHSRQQQISGLFELSSGSILALAEGEKPPERPSEDSLRPRIPTAVTETGAGQPMEVQTFLDDIEILDPNPAVYFDDIDLAQQGSEFTVFVEGPNFYIHDDINDLTQMTLTANPYPSAIEVDLIGNIALANTQFIFDRSSRRLGIGTVAPPHDFSIYDGNPTIHLEDSDSNSTAYTSTGVNMRGGMFVAGNDLRLFTTTSTGAIIWPFGIHGVPNDNTLTIVSQNADARLAGEGYVGIGTINPKAKLHMMSEIGTANVLVEEKSATTAVRTLFQLENNGAPRFAVKNAASGVEWSFQQSGPGNFLISREGTGGPELQVYGTGMVRMGPGGANNFTLYPNGNLFIAGSLTANGSTFPDYVFEPDYDLMPLPDLRTYIQQEKRLPNIPSAEEVKQQGGHNMTELQLKLLEKIEELTLYALEREGRLQEQGQKLSEMQALKQKNAQLEARLAAVEALLSDL